MPSLELSAPGDTYLQIRISRNTLIAFLVSILLHALLLFSSIPLLLLNGASQGKREPIALTVQLAPPVAKTELPPPPVNIPTPLPKPLPAPLHKPSPKVLASPARVPSTTIVPEPPKAPQEPATPPVATPAPVAAPDLLSYMQAARERRRLAEQGASREYVPPAAPEHTPSADEIRTAIIKRNLQTQGTNGLFQILSMESHSAEFSFRGWTTDFSNARREVIEVEIEPGGDLQRAVVRRMIEIIRRHYSGDFNWESPRLGRVVVMSARVEDSAGLEEFLIKEFFGVGPRYPVQ